MDVAAYLKELLYRERVVYVPGLGTFLMLKSAGAYNQERQQFYPPKNSIDFVSEEKQDDALENYISQQKNISPAAARYFIEKFVEQLKTSAHTKNIPIKEALFSAEATAENWAAVPAFNMENFGLPPVHLSQKKTAEPKEEELVLEPIQAESFDQENPEEVDNQETRRKRSTGFWASVLLLLALGLLGCYALYLYDPLLFNRFYTDKPVVIVKKRTVADSATKKPMVKTALEKDTSATKAVTDTSTKVLAATVPASKPAAKDSEVLEAPIEDPDLVAISSYEIIGATFKTLKGAKKFVTQLKEKGMQAKILKTASEKHKLITFGSFKDKESAKAALEKLHARDPNSDAHIQHYIIK